MLIYAAAAGHPLGARVAELFAGAPGTTVGTGSVLLLAEVLAKPLREDPASAETTALVSLLSRLELHPLDGATGRLALALAVAYGLRAADAAHLASAVAAGADRFVTNNRKDFPRTIAEIEVVYPDDLPGPQQP
ncbi:PIN domain-containing protein [Patulibacter brassicae]|uniref:PIN domain-containing protein n=1 Tax=Patulibacter brassicae TaxID=1705717 RepID=A0ABU4VPB0_9ACTN|nr:PIN domain-containing protein [Patulibacter brassicae]MDX8153696.1 PIN domain-containing protein [Patulibacter brassicae]